MTVLYYDEYGAGPPMVLLHGLFGSATNWRGVARSLGDRYRVLVPDARNHGRSPHDMVMTYSAMVEDVVQWSNMLGLNRAIFLGHSMGGKTAMTLALSAPERVSALIVVDIAPVSYKHSHLALVAAMRDLDLSTLRSRTEADRALAESITDDAVRGFLLQNLVLEGGRLSWRLNLPALAAHMDDLVGFPGLSAAYTGPVLFVAGARSDYICPEHKQAIYNYFPNARIESIEAGHWVHAERPALLLETIMEFLRQAASTRG